MLNASRNIAAEVSCAEAMTRNYKMSIRADLPMPKTKITAPSVFEVDLSEIHLCSTIEVGYRQELEALFFFNPKQHLVRERVVKHIERYGNPEIRAQGEALAMGLTRVDQAQTLFLMIGSGRARLVGVVIYVREADCLRVPYVALDETHTLEPSHDFLLYIVGSMKRIGKSIRGVKFVTLSLGRMDACFKL